VGFCVTKVNRNQPACGHDLHPEGHNDRLKVQYDVGFGDRQASQLELKVWDGRRIFTEKMRQAAYEFLSSRL
jgi:hypothetical protein